jgi:CubicO group peptidase (beta-lactamase class C family)
MKTRAPLLFALVLAMLGPHVGFASQPPEKAEAASQQAVKPQAQDVDSRNSEKAGVRALQPESGVPYLDPAIRSIGARIQHYLQVSHVPGLAIAVVHGGKVIYSQGFGVANMDTGARVDADTVFQLASISKPLGATVISTQVSAGKVSWSTPITDALPWFALGTASNRSGSDWVSENLTIGDLYSHRSGLPDHAGDDLEGLGYDRATILRRLRYLSLAPFRVSYAYTNYGIMAGAEAVAQKAGVPWAQLSEQALYKPLGMTRTTSDFKTYIGYPNHAVGHSPIDDNLDGTWRVTPEQYDGDRATAGGGVASSANDMARWMIMLLAGGKAPDGAQLIAPAVLRDCMSPHNVLPMAADATLGSNSAFYGYAFVTGQTSSGLKFAAHNGALAQGTSTNFQIVPALDLGIVVLTNGFPLGLPETVTSDFLELAQLGKVRTDAWDSNQTMFREAIKAAFGSSSVSGDPPPNAKPARPLTQYAGTYRNDYFGDAVVTAANGALRLHMGPADGGMTWTLTHWDGDRFKLRQGTEDAAQTTVSAITFDFSGSKPTLTDEYYQGTSHLGTLTRVE